MSEHRSQFKLDVHRTGWLLLAQSVVINLAMLALPIYTLQLFDRVLISGSIESLVMLLTGVSLFAMSGALFEHLRRTTLNTFADYLGTTLIPVISENTDGSSVNRMLELQKIRQYLKQGTFTPVLDAIWLPITLVVVWMIHPAFGLFIVIINAVFLLAAWLKQRTTLSSARYLSDEQEALQQGTAIGFGVFEWIKGSGLKTRW